MERNKLFALSIVVIIAIVALYIFFPPKGITGNAVYGDYGGEEEETGIVVEEQTYENLAGQVSGSSIVEDIPEDAVITVAFYRNDSEGWRWEGYTLRRGSMVHGDVPYADIRLEIPLSYTEGLNSENFCEVIGEADSNGDVKFMTSLSNSELIWKFRGMGQNRECIGL